MSEIQYPVAYNRNGKIINIQFAEKHGFYICPGCKGRMIANLGDCKQHYFSHYVDSSTSIEERIYASECIKSNESYLHNAFKTGLYNLLKTKIDNQEPFLITWTPSNIGLQEMNLLELVNKIEIETKVDELRPDITLYDKQGIACVAIEIVVCNPPNKNKLKYFSDNKITLFEIDLDKNNLDVLNHIEENARHPSFFSYVPSPGFKTISDKKICETCGETSYFSFLNIKRIKCSKCQTENRFAYRTLRNKEGKVIRYFFDKYTSPSERYLLNIHGFNYNEKTFEFICENQDCGNVIKVANLNNGADIVYSLGYFCQRCQGKKKGEVIYRGIKFQNKVEIKWAEFFDRFGVEYEYHPASGIPAFPVFQLITQNGSKQLFRANNFDKFESIDKDKLELLADKTTEDCIIGFENGHFRVIEYTGLASEEESIFVQCKKCKKYYFKSSTGFDKCRHCGYDDEDNTYYQIGDGESCLFNTES